MLTLLIVAQNLQLKWHPFQLNPSAPIEGVVKREHYRSKFGIQSEQMEARMAEVLLMNNSETSLIGALF